MELHAQRIAEQVGAAALLQLPPPPPPPCLLCCRLAKLTPLIPSPQIVKEIPLKKKQVEDVLGGEEAWKNVQKTPGMWQQSVVVRALPAPLCVSPLPSLPRLTPLHPCSYLRRVRPRRGLLPRDPDPVRGRASDHLLPLHRLQQDLEGGVVGRF